MSRQEFTKRVKLAAWQRCKGHCEKCTKKLFPGDIEYHHDKECTFGGGNDDTNCAVLCCGCHSGITRTRATIIAKSNRVRARHLGIKRAVRPIPGSRASGIRKRMNGTIESW